MKLLASCLLFAILGGCVSPREAVLRAEIAQIKQRVEGNQARIEAKTQTIGAEQNDILTQLHYRPLVAWLNLLNARPAPDRTITYRQTSNGKIARADWDCGILGDGGYYVEFDTSTSTAADVALRNLVLVSTPGTLSLRIPLDTSIRSKLHGHLDPCLGGGKGWRPRVKEDKSFDAVFRLVFLPVADGKVPYIIELTSPQDLSVTAEVDLGDIGTLGIPFQMRNVAGEIGRGELSLLFDQEGTLGPLPDGTSRTYRVRTLSPSFSTDTAGLEFKSKVQIEILP